MKAKLTLDKKLILGFFVEHGEKIAFGAVVLCFLLIVYFAMGGERFNKSPDALIQQADKAKQMIADSDPNVNVTIVEPPSTVTEEIKTKPYEFNKLLVSGAAPLGRNPRIYEPKSFRGEPVLYSVEELRGLGEHGRFAQTGMAWGGAAAGGALGQTRAPLGERWVVVTGVVDNEKIFRSFYDCFKGTRKHTDSDFVPEFRFFQVQRAEVTDENEPVENLKWEQPYKNFRMEYDRFSSTAELVDTFFIHPYLRFALPQRDDGQTWGKEVAHPPEIPLANLDATMPGAAPGSPQAEGVPRGRDPFGAGAGAAGPQGHGPYGGMRPPGAGMTAGGPEGMMPRNMGGYGRPMGGSGQTQATPYYLFRFFDYHVEPGKHYRYRVRIAVTNPNYYQLPQDLVKELRDRMKDPSQWSDFLFSPWSEPSDIVSVPRDDRLLAASVAPARGTDGEPRGAVTAIHWDYQEGEEVHDEFEVLRGWLANFLDQKSPSPQDQTMLPGAGPAMGHGPEGLLGPAGARPPAGRDRRTRGRRPPAAGAGQPSQPEPEMVDYVTEMLVLDMSGGETLGRNRLTAPGEMLLLAPDGNLEVRNDVEDGRALIEQQRAKGTPGQMPPGGFRPGGMLPGGRMLGPGGLRGPMGGYEE